jgi:hypothetical protein
MGSIFLSATVDAVAVIKFLGLSIDKLLLSGLLLLLLLRLLLLRLA